MKPPSRPLGLGLALALCFAAGTSRADDRADEPEQPAPLPAPPPPAAVTPAPPTPPSSDPAPAVSQPARPPPAVYPGPYEPEDPADTLLGSKLTHGGYGAPALKLTTLAGDALMLIGAEGGWVIGRAVVVGAAGYTSATSVVSPNSLQSATGDAHLRISYGGARFGGVVRPLKRTHLTLGVVIGGGAATTENGGDTFRRSERFWVVEPDLGAEINVARYVRFGIGGTYRFVGGADAAGFTPTRLSGPAAALTLRFGQF